MDFNNQEDNLFSVKIDSTVREYLKTAATWARIVAILSFVGAGLTVVDSLVGNKAYANSGITAISFFFGLVVAAIIVVIYLFLYRFANNVTTALQGMNQELFNIGIGNLRTFFKILGILLIIALSFIALIVIFYGLGTMMR